MFDPKYVHFMWNDGLKDKECFFADNIGDLKHRVENNELSAHVADYGSTSFPFKSLRTNEGYKFCYHDPYYELKWAYYVEKKIIQTLFGSDTWMDIQGDPGWILPLEQYRVKPSEEAEQIKEELIADLKRGKMFGPNLSSYKVAIAMWKFIRACIGSDRWMSGCSLKEVKGLFLTGFNVKWNSECWLCDQVVGICSNCPLDRCNKEYSTWRIVNNYIDGNEAISKDQALLACETIIYAHTEMLNRMGGKND